MPNSKIYLGSTNIGSLFQGASDVSIYLGDEKVYPLGEPALKWLATYSDSHTESAQCGSSSEIVRNEINGTNLVSVEIGDCVTSIGELAFDGCSSLTSITIPNSVTTIGRGGLSFTGLIDVVLPNSVTSISNEAFMSCSALTSVTIPSGVTSIGEYAFQTCSNLTSIDIPSGVTSIGSSAFRYCSRLASVTVNATTPPTLGGSVFDSTNNCPIYVPSVSVNAYKTANRWSSYASRIQAIPTPTDNWVLVDEDTFANPRKIKVDDSLIEDDDKVREDYQLYSQDLGTCAIFYLNQPTIEWLIEQGYGGDELLDYYQKVGLFSESDGIIGILEDGVEYTSIGGVNLSDYTLSYISSSMPNYYLYATL